MIQIRKSEERGHAHYGWLDTHHTFSFGDYADPKHTRFRSLRVINEDRVEPGQGFPPHSHQDMEIITVILEGALEHKDSMGNGSVIKPGDVQRMSAGTGVTHSEYNPSSEEPVHLLQIWIFPEAKGLAPGYEQAHFGEKTRRNSLCLIASPHPKNGAVKIHQDAELFTSVLDEGKKIEYSLKAKRYAWLQVARGSAELNGMVLTAGDGAAISEENHLEVTAVKKNSEILLFDLA
ncbi:MAG: pirin family protein [Candidatus Omnitrophica bacterium]|nr:pirin family protein [Candidatus Omnitrophota bacterium]